MKKYVHYGHKFFDKALFLPIENSLGGNKPHGGLWASAVDAAFGWKDWNEAEEFRECNPEDSFTFTLADTARILVIDNCEVLDTLPKLYLPGFPVSLQEAHIMPDFEKVAEKYDVIDFRLSACRELYWKLYGWDCDSILVLHPDVVVEQ